MSRDPRDDLFDARLRAVLEERAEDVASRARTAEQLAAELTSRLPRGRVAAATTGAIRLGWLVVLTILVVALIGAFAAGRPSPPIRLLVAVDLPLDAEPGTHAIVGAIRMAIRDSGNRGGSYFLDLPAGGLFNDTVAGQANDAQGAANARKIVADARYVALIGPYNSSVAEAEIPTTNAAGLLQCGLSNTSPSLTTGDRARAMRPKPDQPTYVRVVATDEGLARGAARFLADRLGASAVYVIDSWPDQVSTGLPYVSDLAAVFASTFEARGGRLVRQTAFPTGSELTALPETIRALAPDAIFFHGPGSDGATLVGALDAAGLANIPVVGVDPLLDGPRSAPGSFLNLAGQSAAHTFALFPTGYDPLRVSPFEAAYRAEFVDSPPRYAVTAYACAQVIIAGLDRLGLHGSASPAEWRESLRAMVTEGGGAFPTILGSIGFDRNGDVQPAAVSVYAYDATSADWAFREAIDASP
jgi:branched-chain amino acid transport system substrate-binding protein